MIPDRPLKPATGVPPGLAQVAAHLGLDLTTRQAEGLHRYVELLQRWNATYNLTSVRDPDRILTHHVYDCLATLPPIRQRIGLAEGRRLLDVGSGAGLPGVILAIALPECSVSCIDAVGKKAAFITQVAAELALPNLMTVHGRVEQHKAPPFDLIVSRAFASLADFVASTRHLLAADGWWLAMKGKEPADEAIGLDTRVMFHVEPLEVPGLRADRCLVWMKPLP